LLPDVTGVGSGRFHRAQRQCELRSLASVDSFTDTTVTGGTHDHDFIRGVNADGESSDSNAVHSIPGDPSPEMDVRDSNRSITDGDTRPGTTEGTDCGSQDVASGSVTRTFTIANAGTTEEPHAMDAAQALWR